MRRKGFTLIELVISMAIFLVIIIITFSVISRYFLIRTFYEQQTELERNLVFAMDTLANDFRQAKYNEDGIVIINPSNNVAIDASENNALSFYNADGEVISYYLKQNPNETCTIYKKVSSTLNGQGGFAQPVSEDMHQLVRLYFTRHGGEIVVTIVGQISSFNATNKISFTSLVYSRNSPQSNISNTLSP